MQSRTSICRRKSPWPEESLKQDENKKTAAQVVISGPTTIIRATSSPGYMANQIKWRQRRQRRRLAPDGRRLRLIKSALGEMARVAFSEPLMIAVERQEIYLRKLPKALDGFRIVQLSDLHYGPMVDPRHLQRAIEIANELRPDMIALTGDYISQERGYAAPCAEIVGRLKEIGRG